MIRDITIGQYYASDSVIHRLDVKIMVTLVYIISLFLFDDFMGYAVAVGFFFLAVGLSKVPFSYIVKGLKPIIFMLVFTGFLNLFWTPGKVFFSIGFLQLTYEGVKKAIFISLRLIFLILGSSLMTLTTTPNQLTDGIEKLLRPLNHIRVPVHELALMMSIALRFIPILVEETDKIMKAQTARGADFESGNVIQRIRNMLPILVPLFISAFRRADELAMAMEARCYRGGYNRTKMREAVITTADKVAYLLMILFLAGSIASRFIHILV